MRKKIREALEDLGLFTLIYIFGVTILGVLILTAG